MIFLFIQVRIYSMLRQTTRWRVVNGGQGKFFSFISHSHPPRRVIGHSPTDSIPSLVRLP